MNPFK